MIGDKIHQDREDPGYSRRMRVALESTPGLVWHGGHPRAEAMRVDVRLRRRAVLAAPRPRREPRAVHEGPGDGRARRCRSCSTAPRCTRTSSAPTTRCSRAPRRRSSTSCAAAADPVTYARARDRCLEAAARLHPGGGGRPAPRTTSRQAFPPAPARGAGTYEGRRGRARPEVLHPACSTTCARCRASRCASTSWPALGSHDPEVEPRARRVGRRGRLRVVRAERRLVQRVAEEARPPGAASRRAPAPLRAVRRVAGPPRHRRDRPGRVRQPALRRPDPQDDRLARREGRRHPELGGRRAVRPRQAARRRAPPGHDRHRAVAQAARPRLDVLERLRREDPTVHAVRQVQAAVGPAVDLEPQPRSGSSFEELFRRIRRSPLLAGAWSSTRPGPDVASWLRRVGLVLSTSDDESFHLAPAEGMASGAVPALLPLARRRTRSMTRAGSTRTPAAMAERDRRAPSPRAAGRRRRARARAEVAAVLRPRTRLRPVGGAASRLLRDGATGRTPRTCPAPAPSA